MRKILSILLCLATAAVMTGCTASAEQYTGEAEGYGGILRVSVKVNGEDITAVEVVEHHETEGVGTRAIDALPMDIANKDSIDVDSISGATRTSEAIKLAVSNALRPTGLVQDLVPAPDKQHAEPAQALQSLTGMGMAATGRVGPGKDSQGNQVYSFNVAFASGVFDEEGRIQHMKIDQLEVATPNLGGGSTFSGFPEDGETEAFMNEVSAWTTKGAMREGYKLTSGTWREQMDVYEQQMVGKTVDEVEAWYTENFDQATGKPVGDATSQATISLRGEYGDILTAVRRAWEDARRDDQPDAQPSAQPTTPDEGVKVDTNTDMETGEMVG